MLGESLVDGIIVREKRAKFYSENAYLSDREIF